VDRPLSTGASNRRRSSAISVERLRACLRIGALIDATIVVACMQHNQLLDRLSAIVIAL